MSLSEHLSSLRINHQVDSRARHRIGESSGSIKVAFISADSSSAALNKSLQEPETPLAFITSSARIYVLSLGLVGTIFLQGPEITNAQEIAISQLATRLKDELDITLEGWPIAPVKKTKAKAEPVAETPADPVADEVDNPEPTE